MTRWLLTFALTFGPAAGTGAQTAPATPLDRMKALAGDWIDVDGAFGKKGAVAVTYRVTGGGTAVVETFPIGAAEEMVTVYYKDGSDLVLTHYCSAGNQPRMRAKSAAGNVLTFEYDGGTNIDAATTSHMHGVTFEFISKDEVKASWQNWSNGKADHMGVFRLQRKK